MRVLRAFLGRRGAVDKHRYLTPVSILCQRYLGQELHAGIQSSDLPVFWLSVSFIPTTPYAVLKG